MVLLGCVVIKIFGLNNIVKPNNIQNNSNSSFRFALSNVKADSFEHSKTSENNSTCPINFTGKSNRLKEYRKITTTLNQMAETAQTSLNNQVASDGWAGKTAETISILWNSKNRAKIVQEDINQYKDQVLALNNSIKDDKFKDKFKEIFDVEYNHSNIAKYGRKSKQLESALIADCVSKYTEEKLSKNLKIYNKLDGDLQDISETRAIPYGTTGYISSYTHVTSKDDIFQNMENSLVEILGDKKILDKVLSSKGLDSEKATKEDKYKVYGHLSKFILESTKTSAEKCLKGQSLAQIKEDYDKTYEKAFGTKNDIIARVDKYNASQKAGAACVKFVTGVVLNAIGPSSVLASLAYSAATSVAVDIADAATNKIDGDFNLKATAINAGLNGISGAVNQSIVNKYAGGVASKILESTTGKTASNVVGSTLNDFVINEIISKEGVKIPAYAVEGVLKSVVQNMTNIKPSNNDAVISQKDLENSMVVLSKAMVYMTEAKNNGKLNKNMSQKEIVALLNKHIVSTMKDNQNLCNWINKNNSALQQMLVQLVKSELS